MAAQAGATLAELMTRMGHSTAKAALVYQHVAEGRDRIIAERMALLAVPALAPDPRAVAGAVDLDLPEEPEDRLARHPGPGRAGVL
jgi:hypothetical protein